MPSSTREAVMRCISTVSSLQPASHTPLQAPYPDEIDHTLFRAFTRSAHDLGGDPDVPIHWEEKEEEQWEANTFATCECLAWRGVWNAEERRRRQNAEIGLTQYLGLPYYGRWLMSAALVMVDKKCITLTELVQKIEEVKKRYERKSAR